MELIKIISSVESKELFEQYVGKIDVYIDTTEKSNGNFQNYLYKVEQIYKIFDLNYKYKNVMRAFYKNELKRLVIDGNKVLFLTHRALFKFLSRKLHYKAVLCRELLFDYLSNIT